MSPVSSVGDVAVCPQGVRQSPGKLGLCLLPAVFGKVREGAVSSEAGTPKRQTFWNYDFPSGERER